ncbi:MAG: type IV pilus biogenesis/stability protein PilW [Arenicella sp.]|nr:type IV pilus biogenesis/stability protein PilW [Arenicella sp.]
MLKNITSVTAKIHTFLLLLFMVVGLGACATSGQLKQPKTESETKIRTDQKALIHAQLGRGYMEQGQLSTAKDSLTTALRISPNHSDSNYVMALLMSQLKQYPQAEKHFSRAIAADRENSPAAHDFGTFLCQIGQGKRAKKYFDIAVSNPLFRRAELSYMRAGECLASIDSAEAEVYLKKALSINPRLAPALFKLARMKFDARSYLSSRAYIERLLAITEPQPDSLLLAYQIELSLNAAVVAAEYRTKLLTEFPASVEARAIRKADR